MTDRRHHAEIVFFSVLGVLGASASGPLIETTLGRTSVSILALVCWRNLLGASVMATPTLLARPEEFLRLRRTEIGWSVLAGLMLALHFVTFFKALTLTSVAASTALGCLDVAWIVLWGLVRGHRLPRRAGIGLAVSLAGVVAITGIDLGHSRAAVEGDLYALACGVFVAVYTMAGGRARTTMSTGTYTAVCYGSCALAVGVAAVISGERLIGFDAAGWYGIVALTVTAQLMGHSSFNHLVRWLTPLQVSMLVLLEIPGAAVLAAAFLGERLAPLSYLGLVAVGIGLVVVLRTPGEPAFTPVDGFDPTAATDEAARA